MTKGYHRFLKMDLLSSKSENDEDQDEHDKKKSLHRSSQKLIRKLRKITMHTISSDANEAKSSSNSNDERKNRTTLNITSSVSSSQSSLESIEERKLKSILKASSKEDLVANESNDQAVEIAAQQETSQPNSAVNSPKSIKHVRFNENVSSVSYQSNKSVCSLLKLSRRHRKKLKKRDRKEPSGVLSGNENDVSSSESLVFEPLSDSETTDNDD